MRSRTLLFTCAIFVSTVISKISSAQDSPADSSSQQNAFNNAKLILKAAIGDQSQFYNGREYYFYDPHIKSNAYFMDVNNFTSGSVFYDGAFCNGVSILYDLYADEVAALLYNHFSIFKLVKEKVKYFDYLGHHFINISTDSLGEKSVIKSGYYDELYSGKMQVLVKREKSIQETSNSAGPERYFTTPSRAIFLKEKNSYYSITNEKSLLNVLNDKKKELQRFIRSSQIKFKKDPENAVVKISSYYDQITN